MSVEGVPDPTETYHDFAKSLAPGSSLASRYTIVKLLGVGGMGRVYLAHDEELHIDVALKIIRPELLADEKIIDRFKNELILARRVSHKNVVRIHDIGEVNGLKYLTMSYVPGKSLRDILMKSERLPVDQALSVITQVCEGVIAAHEEGVIHRDLKPGNIILDETDRIYITDFGIARSLDSGSTSEADSSGGTPAYSAPEQLRGEKPDIRSDVYAIGLILYEMLAGELPFGRDTAHEFRTKGPVHLDQTLRRRNSEIPSYLAGIVKKCVDPYPDFRYKNVKALLADLQHRKVSTEHRNWISAHKTIVAIVSLVLVGLLTFLWIARKPEKASSASQVRQPPVLVHSLAILPFLNQTGRQDLAWVESALTDLLITDLSQSQNLRVISSDRIFKTLHDLKIPSGTYDQETVNLLARILDAKFVVQGTFTQAGTMLRADVRINDIANPAKPAYLKATGSRAEDLFAMVGRLAQQIERQFAADARIIKTHSAPIDVLRRFHEGLDHFRRGNYDGAASGFEETIRKDPGFLRAYLKLSETYKELGQVERARTVLQDALRISKENDPKTHSLIRAEYAVLQDDLQSAIDLYHTIGKTYPNDPDVSFNLAIAYEQKGDLNEAIRALERVIQQDPYHPQAYFHLGKDTILTGEAEKAISHHLIKALSIERQLNNAYGEADVLNAMGVAYERLGRYEDAVRYYNDSIAMKEKIGNKKGAATSMNNVAKIYVFEGEYAKAEKILKRTLEIFWEIDDRQGISSAMNMFGVISEDQGQLEDALNYYRKALQIRKDLGNDQFTAQSYDNIGHIYFLMSQYDNAHVYWQQALALRKSMGEGSGIILSLQNMGFLHKARGELDDALKSFLESLERSRPIQYENAIAVSLGNLGMIYQVQGRYNAAIDSYQEAIQILNDLKDKKGVGEYTKCMADAFLDLHNFSRAREKLDSALALAREIGAVDLTADLQILVARYYRLQGNFLQAQKEIEQAMRGGELEKYSGTLLRARLEKGFVLLEMSEYSDAERLLTAVLRQAKEIDDVWSLLASNVSLADLNLRNQKPLLASQFLETALKAAEKMGFLSQLYRIHSLAGQAYLAMNQKEKALKHWTSAEECVERIKKNSKGEYLSNFGNIPAVKAIYEARKGLP